MALIGVTLLAVTGVVFGMYALVAVERRLRSVRLTSFRRVAGRPAPGQAIVELAFFISVFLMLALGVYEFGRAFQAQIVVVQAAREGARVGMDPATSSATIQAAVTAAARPYTLQAVSVTYPSAGQVRVTATHRFTSGIWFVGDIDIAGSMLGRRV